jgi:porphobilinogen synthase
LIRTIGSDVAHTRLTHRPRRLRRTAGLRALVRETHLDVSQLVYPLFVVPGRRVRRPIESLPGQFHLSADSIVQEGERALGVGVRAVLLFGVSERKDETGSDAWNDTAPVQQAVRALRGALPELTIMTDVCLCEYTSHGHCGVLEGTSVRNDETLPLLARAAVSHAEAGTDVVAPSDMMDGRVAAIRTALDEAGFAETAILSYAAKYASAFYGPFRDAAGSAPSIGDRRGYQMDPPNAREAVSEVRRDLDEGADMVMVKPALAYLDVIRRVRRAVRAPLAAYNVSGEYAMVRAAAAAGWLEERRAVLEILTAIRRAGADVIFTYHALDAAKWIAEEKGTL